MKNYDYVVSVKRTIDGIYMPIKVLGGIQNVISYIKSETNLNFDKWLAGYSFEESNSGEKELIDYMNIDLDFLYVRIENDKYQLLITKLEKK